MSRGRITQVKIAKAVGIGPDYFNHILRKRCGETLYKKLAFALNQNERWRS